MARLVDPVSQVGAPAHDLEVKGSNLSAGRAELIFQVEPCFSGADMLMQVTAVQ